jgi:hypothetical protein
MAKAKEKTAKRKRIPRATAIDHVYASSTRKALNINYKIAGDVVILYADQFIVQFYPDEFVISFFQSEHPLIFSEEDFEKRDALEARCIARFALNPPQMRRLFQALQTNLKRWTEMHFPEALQEEESERAK